MPELPEVETTVRGLRAVLDGRRLVGVEVRRPDLRRAFPEDLGQRLTGARVTGLRYLPVYVQRGWENSRRAYRVVPVSPEMALTWSPAPTEADRRRMAQVREELGLLLGGQVGVTAR